jgi:glycosyltransferase involved in cell wall biosynthesis
LEPQISVLLPVYNGEAYLREAIESVLSQGYSNFELIIVDNHSTDGTAGIIAEFSNDNRIRVIRNEKTIPRLENFVKVFSMASKESCWYKFIGDDDRLLPDCLNEMVRVAEKYKNIGLVTSYYYNGQNLVTGVLPLGVELASGSDLLHRMLIDPKARRTLFSPTAVLLSPKVYHEMGGFRTDLLHADAELFYRILNRYDLAYIHKPLMKIGYHSESGQAESTKRGDTFSEAYLIRYHNLKLYDNIKLGVCATERIKMNLVIDSTGYMLARLIKGDFKAALSHLKKIPPACFYHLLPAAFYFLKLTLVKMICRQPIRLFERNKK